MAPRIVALSFLSVGIFVLMQVILPIISFEFWLIGQKYSKQWLIAPTIQKSEQVLGVSLDTKDNFPYFVSNIKRESKPNYVEFSLSIPRLKIEKEDVLVDNNDLDKGLAHLPGSALPGEKGNVFISGHSALSRFFARNNAYFAKLEDLKKGDEILVEVMGTKFVYKVWELKVINPNDLSVVLPPDTQGRYITLMTCVPPGLNFKRLIVLGKLQ